MQPENFDLEKLLQPLSREQFFAEYWEQRHYFLPRGRLDYFETLLTRSDVETIISNSDMRYPAVQLAKGGGYFPPEAYTRNIRHGDETFAGVPDVRQIIAEYRAGATVVLPALHRTWMPLGLLCDNLQTELDHAPHANVYITPGNAAGFTPHYDVHEVFVLQITGKKLWNLYPPPIQLPHRSQPFAPLGYAAPAPMAQVEMHAGDLLYLPRGTVHSTTTSDSYSAHVTIGISVYTWVDLAKEFLASAIDNPVLRGALPPGFASRDNVKSELRKKMTGIFDLVRAGADPDKLIDAFTSRVRSAHAPRRDVFRADVTMIHLDSILKSPSPESYAITQEGDRTMLEFQGVRYHVLTPMASTLHAMCALTTFRPSELPDHLNVDGRLGFSRYLRDIGFLTLVK